MQAGKANKKETPKKDVSVSYGNEIPRLRSG